MKRLHYQLLFFSILILTWFPGFSEGVIPVPIDSADFNRIQHKQVRKLITRQKHYGIQTFDDMRPVCYAITDSNMYRTYQKSGFIKQDINVVWNNLVHQSPSDEFNSRIVTFGLMYSKRMNKLLYENESYEGIEEGQILFFNLHVLGIKNLAVALEVTRMDNDLKEIEYCYVDHGSTRGTQKFMLKPTPEGYTEITQITKYKCKSRLRNQKLYSFFHERIVNEFFAGIKRKSESGKDSLTAD
jgi:hypothetical protein